MKTINIFVPGIPKPAGSKRPMRHSKTGKLFCIDSSGQAGTDWRATVKAFALDAMNRHGLSVFVGPIYFAFDFFMPRPKGHYRKDGTLKPNAPRYHTVRPDATKLVRAAEDALTGILWKDDAEVAKQTVTKPYSNDGVCGVAIHVAEMSNETGVKDVSQRAA